MTYLPVRTIRVVNNRLIESVDLTKPLSFFINTESYLVLKQSTFLYTLSLNNILTYTSGLDLTKPVITALSALFTDAFVTKFQTSTIPLATSAGFYNKRLTVFNPIAYKGYHVHFTSVNTPTVIDDVTKKGFLDDLAIVSDNDMSQCLVSVNGVFHRTVYQNGVLYVIDGFRTIRISGRKDVVVVDTRTVGGHTIIPLTSFNVTKSDYQQDAVVSLNQSIAGKTVFAVIDGYFYHRDHSILTVADDTHLKIKTNKSPLIEQFRHNPRTLYQVDRLGADASQSSRQYTDAYEKVFLNNSSIPTASLATADFQYSRLTAFHSFLVVMNNPHLYTLSTEIVPTGTPQFYQDLSSRRISGMMNYGCGLCPSYLLWKDVYERTSVLLPKQDYDTDWQNQSVNSPFVPTLSSDSLIGTKAHAELIDYVCA